MDSIQISIEANERQQEILISQLSDLGAEGFEQQEGSLIAYFNPQQFLSYEVNALLRGFTFHMSTIAEQNWNAVWESNFPPVVVKDFCAVRAHFHEPVKTVQHEIIITPKMSFGTGHHATTYMMIGQMEDISFTGKTVFDFGTGTGILAILAEKLGACAVEAIDVDEWSIRNAQENMDRNDCGKISVRLSTEIPLRPFDIILANINRNVILEYMPALEKAIIPGGYILLSGLMMGDEQVIRKAAEERRLKFEKRTEQNNWICLLFSKPV